MLERSLNSNRKRNKDELLVSLETCPMPFVFLPKTHHSCDQSNVITACQEEAVCMCVCVCVRVLNEVCRFKPHCVLKFKLEK